MSWLPLAVTRGYGKIREETPFVKPAKFHIGARINDYGFLNFRAGVFAALDRTKGMDLTIEKNPDGSITVRKV